MEVPPTKACLSHFPFLPMGHCSEEGKGGPLW